MHVRSLCETLRPEVFLVGKRDAVALEEPAQQAFVLETDLQARGVAAWRPVRVRCAARLDVAAQPHVRQAARVSYEVRDDPPWLV